MGDGLQATVLICTRNRGKSLARTLRSIQNAAAHVDVAWELVIVDNGSIDGTPAVVQSFKDKLPIRAVFEESPGLSHARNRGVREAAGRYLVWTDDDVEVDPGWLSAYLRAFAARPEAAVFGGRAVPRYEAPVQQWMVDHERNLLSLLAVRDDPNLIEITRDQTPWGLNYAVRALEQRRFPYDPELGVAPGRRRGGEESAVIRAMLDLGLKGYWVWDATVFHLIPAHRQTTDYVFEYYFANGYDFPVGGSGGSKLVVAGVPLWILKRTAGALLSYGTRKLLGSSAWVVPLIEYSRCRGTMARLRSER